MVSVGEWYPLVNGIRWIIASPLNVIHSFIHSGYGVGILLVPARQSINPVNCQGTDGSGLKAIEA
jgi:hypothetical protein